MTDQPAIRPQNPAATQQAFRLGGDPPKVARLSRKSLAILGIVAGLGIGGSLIVALQPASRDAGPELFATDGRAKADGLSSAPKDYSQVPALGPPLPGDLGKPMLSAQQRDPSLAYGRDVSGPPSRPVDTARDRARQDLAAARASQLFLGGSAGMKTDAQPSADTMPGVTVASFPSAAIAIDGSPDTSGNAGEKLAFLNRQHNASSLAPGSTVSLASPNILLAGSIIPAALITGARSDLPGQLSAQVTQNIYDSPTGRTLLIPQGSRLVGEYDSQIDAGQSRLMMVWSRLIFPDGRSIQLARQPGTDAAGFAGMQDGVDNHWSGTTRAALISSLLGIGTELANDSDGDLVRALRGGTQGTINQAGQQIVQHELAIRPTLTIRPGHPLRVMVTQDLILQPWESR